MPVNKNHLYAIRESDGKFIFVDNVPNGKKCGCICSKCKEPLDLCPFGMPDGEFNEPPQCMPDEYKVPGCSITAYWNYYEQEFIDFESDKGVFHSKNFKAFSSSRSSSDRSSNWSSKISS